MIHEHETIWMWAWFGDTLFWDQEGGSIGDCHSLITDWRCKEIDLSSIEGLEEWYNRFDNDEYPADKWSPEEYSAWKEEGWKYARAVRRILPDEIELLYDHDENGKPYPVPRENRIVETHPVISTDRLIREAEHFILESYNRTLNPTPYVDFIKALCKACPCEELIAGTHCWWSREEKELRIQWYKESLDCYIKFGPNKYRDDGNWDAQWSIGQIWAPKEKEMPIVDGIGSVFEFDGNSIEADDFFNRLSWYIIDRGMK